VFEALNNVAAHTKRLIVVLNDNEWSIDRNVGAIAKYFNSIATHPAFANLHQKAAKFVEFMLGEGVRRFAEKLRAMPRTSFCRRARHRPIAAVLFDEFGIRYYGPIDGHNLPLLIQTFEFLKTQDEPVILHIITEKGRGYTPALNDPGKFHGLGKYSVETGETAASDKPTYSQVFARSVTDFAKADEKIVAITGAMPGGTGLSVFKKEIPERYFDVGIAEEHAALFACGLSTRGLKPFLTIYSTFMQRAFDMILHDMAIQNLPVRMCMDRGGLSGDDGPTHHGLFDIAYLRGIPGSSTCSRATKTSSWTCSGPWPATKAAPSPSATRVATAPAPRPRTSPSASKSARPKSSPMATTSPSSPSATCSPSPRPPRKNSKPKASPSPSSIRAGSSPSTWPASNPSPKK
jgi:1-deoxy-D-xylulose-5-phosphate synthase